MGVLSIKTKELSIKIEVVSIKIESLWSFCVVFIRHSKNLNT
jgi:hypothetical protein